MAMTARSSLGFKDAPEHSVARPLRNCNEMRGEVIVDREVELEVEGEVRIEDQR